MRPKVVENDNVTSCQLGYKFFVDPTYKALTVHRREHRTQGDPAVQSHGAHQRQVAAPIHRGPFDILDSLLHPCVATGHGKIQARLVEKDHFLGSNASHPLPVFNPLGYDVRPQLLTRA